jgi:hypothetical protein
LAHEFPFRSFPIHPSSHYFTLLVQILITSHNNPQKEAGVAIYVSELNYGRGGNGSVDRGVD